MFCGLSFGFGKNGLEASVFSSSKSCAGIRPASSCRGQGLSNRTLARNNTAASASSDIVQVNRRLLKKMLPSPSWFFSKDCAGSIQGRTWRNTCCTNRLAIGNRPSNVSCSAGRCANCRRHREASQQQAHNSGSGPTPNQCFPICPSYPNHVSGSPCGQAI